MGDLTEEAIWTKIASRIDFNDYVTCDKELPICTTKESEISELSELINKDSDDIKIGNPKPTKFLIALCGLETQKTYLMQYDVNDTIFYFLHTVEKELLQIRITNYQTSITYYTFHIIDIFVFCVVGIKYGFSVR